MYCLLLSGVWLHWGCLHMQWILGKLSCIVWSYDHWEFPLLIVAQFRPKLPSKANHSPLLSPSLPWRCARRLWTSLVTVRLVESLTSLVLPYKSQPGPVANWHMIVWCGNSCGRVPTQCSISCKEYMHMSKQRIYAYVKAKNIRLCQSKEYTHMSKQRIYAYVKATRGPSPCVHSRDAEHMLEGHIENWASLMNILTFK